MSNQQNSPVEEMESLSSSNSSSRDPLLDTSSHALLPTDAHAFIERYGLKEDDYEIFDQAATDLFLLSSDPDAHDSTTMTTTTTTTTRLLPDARNTNPIPNNPRKPKSQPKTKWHHPLPLYLIVLALCLGAMSQGWSQASINGANLYYPQDFHLDNNNSSTTHNTLIIGIINAAIYLSNGLIGSWLVAPLNARYGRRGATFLGGAICVVMNFLSGWSSSSWEALLGFRLLLGVGLGVVSSSLNVFAAEVAPAQIRGALSVGWQMFCAGGIFVGLGWNLVVDQYWGNYYWRQEEEEEHEAGMRWRVMLMAGAVPAVVLIVLIWWCPESPAWYVKHGEQYGKAFDSLCRIRNSKLEAARELLLAHQQQQKRPSRTNTTTTAIQHDDDDNKNSSSSFRQIFFELYTVPRLRRATIASYTVMLSQQLCGINIIAFYSSNIFVSAHFSPFAAELASTIFGLCNFLGALPAIFTMDTFGRRSLLLYTLPLMGLTLACTSFTFSPSTTDPPHTQNFPLLTTSLIYIFCLLYSPGMGPVPAIYSAEVFPLSHREIGTSSSVAVTNLFAAILSLTFPYLLARMGTQGSFMLYAILNLVAWGLVFVLVPETKQLTLEKGLEEVFEQPTREFVRGKVRRCVFWGR